MHHQKYEGVIYGLINENYNAPSEYAEGICGLINENHNALHSYQKYDEGIASL